jgi:hypothetical protein
VTGKQVLYANTGNIEQALSKKLKNRTGLKKTFTQGLTTQFGRYRGHPAGRAEKTQSLDAQRAGKWSTACEISAATFRAALSSHQTQELGMLRRNLTSDVMSAKG